VGLIHVLMLSRAIEAQVTIEELCDTLRQIDEEADGQEPDRRGGTQVDFGDRNRGSARSQIPRVDFW